MPEQFYSLTWNQYQLKVQGYVMKSNNKKDLARWAVWHVMASNAGAKNIPPMEKLLPLSTDKKVGEADKMERLKQRLIQAGKKL